MTIHNSQSIWDGICESLKKKVIQLYVAAVYFNSNFYGYHIGYFDEGRLDSHMDYTMLRREYLNWSRVKSL